MKTFSGFSCFLTIAVIFFGISSKYVLAEEKCPHSPLRQNPNLNRLFDQSFGLSLTPDDFLTSMMSPWTVHDYFRPWRKLSQLSKDLGSTITTNKDQFEVSLDVQHFSPEEIKVKTADRYVVIEGKHEEKEDEHGFVSRQFVRRYALPEGTEPEDVLSQLSSDGVLTVFAPRKVKSVKGERVVGIIQTGPVRREASEDKKRAEESCPASNKESCGKA